MDYDKQDMEPVRQPLRIWGRFYRNRRKIEKAGSAEGNYVSPQRNHHEPIPGDPEPRPEPNHAAAPRIAAAMDELISATFARRPEEEKKPNLHYRSLCYWYVFGVRPGFVGPPIWPVLRILSRAAGYRIDAEGYSGIVFSAECKLLPLVYNMEALAYKPNKLGSPVSAATPPALGRSALPSALWTRI